MQRCFSNDYETLFGSAPNTSIIEIYLVAESETGGRIEILFDDFYLYGDPTPDVHSVVHSPSSPEADDAVEVTAIAIDPSLDTVRLYYRVDEGSWTNLEMSLIVDDSYNASIPGQPEDSVVEYIFLSKCFCHLHGLARTRSESSIFSNSGILSPVLAIRIS